MRAHTRGCGCLHAQMHECVRVHASSMGRRAFVPVERKLLEAALRLVPPPFAVLCARCLPLSHRSPTACAARVRSYRSHSCDLHVDRWRNRRRARASACAKRRQWITAVRLRVVWRAPHCAPACCGANVRCRVVPCGRCGRVVRWLHACRERSMAAVPALRETTHPVHRSLPLRVGRCAAHTSTHKHPCTPAPHASHPCVHHPSTRVAHNLTLGFGDVSFPPVLL